MGAPGRVGNLAFSGHFAGPLEVAVGATIAGTGTADIVPTNTQRKASTHIHTHGEGHHMCVCVGGGDGDSFAQGYRAGGKDGALRAIRVASSV